MSKSLDDSLCDVFQSLSEFIQRKVGVDCFSCSKAMIFVIALSVIVVCGHNILVPHKADMPLFASFLLVALSLVIVYLACDALSGLSAETYRNMRLSGVNRSRKSTVHVAARFFCALDMIIILCGAVFHRKASYLVLVAGILGVLIALYFSACTPLSRPRDED